ncbi:heme peroxidase [Polychytrium aggregatum]|uniref:heme peroxidase n=1 Tax=Polychytrium aggregatum TaxID=110093 RepID=UPI0022FEDD2A|nr:heme peroxidase [Polychytrium aggregatum]KAI9202721.1 heme peroxidase [Polychytrium aggregatum]
MDRYEPVRQSIADIIPADWDDGSLGPLLVRLAWHASGTYDRKTGRGGSNGATMRFEPESTDEANNGLDWAREYLEPVKDKHPWISYADLWTLAGVVAIRAMGGPEVPWRPGRRDVDASQVQEIDVPKPGLLPDAAQGSEHLRQVFYRMGFSDREIVALSGAHTLGRCHPCRTGYTGVWTSQPTRFTNQYFVLLSTVQWTRKQWDGLEQYQDPEDRFMMLPTDMALIHDPQFAVFVRMYADDQALFFRDFAAAYGKLLELGVPFGCPAHGGAREQNPIEP